MSKEIQSSSNSGPHPGKVFAVIFYIVAAILAIVGLSLAYQDSNYDTEIVGGDAYNYIIFTTRGIVWTGSAIFTSVIGLAFQLSYLHSELVESN